MDCSPPTPPRVTDGNSCALAWPALAVAACRSASLLRMSGRRRSRSPGRPTGTSGGSATSACGNGPSRSTSAPGGSASSSARRFMPCATFWSMGGSCASALDSCACCCTASACAEKPLRERESASLDSARWSSMPASTMARWRRAPRSSAACHRRPSCRHPSCRRSCHRPSCRRTCPSFLPCPCCPHAPCRRPRSMRASSFDAGIRTGGAVRRAEGGPSGLCRPPRSADRAAGLASVRGDGHRRLRFGCASWRKGMTGSAVVLPGSEDPDRRQLSCQCEAKARGVGVS